MRRSSPPAPWALLLALTLSTPAARAQQANAQGALAAWYVSPYVGGITPDKPWGATGSALLYGLDVGVDLAPAWSAELDLNDATLEDRADSGHSSLSGAALTLVRVFGRGARIAPYVSLGAGATRFSPAAASSLESRTEFMWQLGAGAMVRLWERGDGAMSIALRPDIKVRWTHGWAHAPGNPVDPLYALGLTFAF